MKTKHEEYFSKLLSAVSDLINNPENENHIDLTEDDVDATDFCYAIGVMLPSYVTATLQNEECSYLDTNHLMNSLIVQYGEIKFVSEEE